MELGSDPATLLLLAGLDVDLGVDTDLTETQQNAEFLEHLRLTRRGPSPPPLVLETRADAHVDLFLLWICELQMTNLLDWIGGHGETRRCLAHVSCPCHIQIADPLLVLVSPLAGTGCDGRSDELQIRDGVVHLVDNRRGSQNPLVGCLDLENRLCLLGLGITNRLRLVDDDAVIVLALAELRFVGNLVVVGDVDGGLGGVRRPLLQPPATIRRGSEEVDLALHGRLLPLFLDGERHDNQSLLGRAIHDERQGLDRLAETHLVAENSTSDSVLCRACLTNLVAELLLTKHPGDSLDLVLSIGDSSPCWE